MQLVMILYNFKKRTHVRKEGAKRKTETADWQTIYL